jgi:hypothetical protein
MDTMDDVEPQNLIRNILAEGAAENTAPPPAPRKSKPRVEHEQREAIEVIATKLHALELKLTKTKPKNKINVARKAKSLFYHASKEDDDIISPLHIKLSSIGIDLDKLPWQLVRQHCDAEFDRLPEEDQEVWLERARKIADEREQATQVSP